MKKLMLLFTLIALLSGATACASTSHGLSWTWPVTNCDQSVLDSADFITSELIYSITEMPMSSDSGDTCGGTDGDPPLGSLSVNIPLDTDAIVLNNLQPGQTYYARIRVSAYSEDNWSSWSQQAVFTVAYSRPNIIKFTRASKLARYEYYEIKTTHLKLFGS